MTEQTLKQQWFKLAEVRSCISKKMSAEGDKQVRMVLFEAHRAIGVALLNLEDVDFCVNGESPSDAADTSIVEIPDM